MLILASNSPRRKEILKMLGYEFKVTVSEADENIEYLPPEDTVTELSKRKALAVKAEYEDTVIGADTVVAIDNKILGKPKDKKDAYDMLKLLSNRKHTVYTGVTVITKEKIITDYVSADVYFREILDFELENYLNTDEPYDKAGAYAIQGMGGAFTEKIDGDFYAVMGLPACYISKTLNSLNIFPKVK